MLRYFKFVENKNKLIKSKINRCLINIDNFIYILIFYDNKSK